MKDKEASLKERLRREASSDEEYLITYTRHLEKRLRNLETEKQLLDAERLRLEQELYSLRNEIDRLREPPLVTAVVVKVGEDTGKVSVLSSTGPIFTVNVARRVKDQKLEPGMFVNLNQRTFAIMEILSITKEDIKFAKSQVFRE
jgi:proteasome regulatory subunit